MKTKKRYLSATLVLLFSGNLMLISCTADAVKKEEPLAMTTHAITSVLTPENQDNAYDYVGRIHNELLEQYWEASFSESSVPVLLHRLDSLAQLHTEFNQLPASDYASPNASEVAQLTGQSITAATAIVNATDLSTYGKSTLSNFISTVLDFSTGVADYEEAHFYLVAYEAALSADALLTPHDQEVLLSLSSVARYSLYAKKKPKKNRWDPDWDFLVGNIFGSIAGIESSKAQSITLALAVGIAQNE